MLSTILKGLILEIASSIGEAENKLREAHSLHRRIDFLILDDQSDVNANYLARLLPLFSNTKSIPTQLIHFHTATKGCSGITDSSVTKMPKPPRTYELLKKLDELSRRSPSKTTSNSEPNDTPMSRTLYGNVLVAEGNDIAYK